MSTQSPAINDGAFGARNTSASACAMVRSMAESWRGNGVAMSAPSAAPDKAARKWSARWSLAATAAPNRA